MAMRKQITPESARLRMADLCARSEQCEYDIRQKLLKMGIRAEAAAEIIGYLIDNRFIDNSRYALSFARDKCRFSLWGPYKIRQGLLAKRIPASDISTAIASLEESELYDAILRSAKGKARSLSLHGGEGREGRMKLYRHLLSRGFDSRMSTQAVREMIAATTT